MEISDTAVSENCGCFKIRAQTPYDDPSNRMDLHHLRSDPAIAVDGSVAPQLEAKANFSLDPSWTLRLDGSTTIPNETIPEPESQTFADVTVPDYYPSTPFSDQNRASIFVSVCQGRADTRDGDISIFTNESSGSSAPLKEPPYSVDLAKSPMPIPAYTLTEPNHPITREPSKRKRISTFLSRKKQLVTTPQASQIDHRKAVKTSVVKAPAHKTSLPRPSPPRKSCIPGVSLSPRASEIIRTDWVADWQQAGGTRHGTDGAGIVRDVNVAGRDRRPVSWPRRQHFRKSLDISVAVLTKSLEKKFCMERGT